MKLALFLSVFAATLTPTLAVFNPCDMKVDFKKPSDTWALQVYTGMGCTGEHDYYSHELKELKGHHGCFDLVKAATHVRSYVGHVVKGPKFIRFYTEFNCSGGLLTLCYVLVDNDAENVLTEGFFPELNLNRGVRGARSFQIAADWMLQD
ncbi:hypothetical protein BJ138DRAFT_1161888 [Hygrophoropsis aurantiaca]|uniref:Uncharacterized protein n=1 Tax=Hygrophoropsis aurantiaca TaxID=72124 RepID=A0ACB8A091_9AGAM|nr:hypothetical protein BJ138DRAFT_1161888 [Hygrophoropsis aurantiaca]